MTTRESTIFRSRLGTPPKKKLPPTPYRTTIVRRSVLGNICFDIIRNGDLNELIKFINNKGDIQCKDANGVNALMIACGKGDFGMVKVIVESGLISPTERDDKGRNCLHHLCLGRKENKDIFYLIKPNLLIGSKDIEDQTPLQIAIQCHLKLLTKWILELNDYQNVSMLYHYSNAETQRIVNTNRFGFITDDTDKTKQFRVKEMSKKKIKQNNLRIPKWTQMITFYKKGVEHKKLLNRTYKGMPNEVRSDVWKMIITKEIEQNEGENEIQRLIDEYHQFNELGTCSPGDKQLDIDVKRVLKYHHSYRNDYCDNQKVLFMIFHALLSSNNPINVEYVQGILDAPALFPLYLDDETSYLGSILIMKGKYRWKEMFNSNFVLLMNCWKVQRILIERRNPKIAQRLRQMNILDDQLPYFLFDWHYRWFTPALPFDLVLRIMDVLLLEGFEILFSVADTIFHFLEVELKENFDVNMFQMDLKTPFELMTNPPTTNQFMKYLYKHRIPANEISALFQNV